MLQDGLFEDVEVRKVEPFREQLLKWVGNKQRFANEIVSYFPPRFGTYFEPFLGSGAVLGTLMPERAVASDCFKPLAEIWQTLRDTPNDLKQWYESRWNRIMPEGKETVYEDVKRAYNARPNCADLLFLCRSCYGGIVRFRKADGYMSTPCGVHHPMPPEKFARRVETWHRRTSGAEFRCADFEETMELAGDGDVVYCDPPYSDSQGILYGAQDFDLNRLFAAIHKCKLRGAMVILSIDGTKRSGNKLCDMQIPDFLFAREAYVNCGRSMLRRFQMGGQTLESEIVHDRLLLTY